jgi:tRNA threonylcarbamoyladenosine biosynthesis protein TsaE
MEKVITNNSLETKKLAEDFAKKLNPGDIVCLFGNLGAGKTTFVQGLVKGLGIVKRIISPTFVIIRSYKINLKNTSQSSYMFYHVDLYRIHGEPDIESTGLIDILENKNAIIAIEWPEKMGSIIPTKRWEIKFNNLSGDDREINFKYYDGH